MTRYYIHIPSSIATVDVDEGIVLRSTLPFVVGKNLIWEPLRGYLQNMGCKIEPELEEHPRFIEYDDVIYELVWVKQCLTRVFKQSNEIKEEIRFSELPDCIKRLL